jgi:DNA-binding NarL/FixJ family response regulator
MDPAPAPPVETRRANVLLVDDHPVLRDGFAQLIDHEPDLHVCGQASSAAEALTALERSTPDLVVVDISLPGMDGIELIKNIRARFGSLRILVLSMYDEKVYAERAFQAGASGYVMKQAPTEQVMEAIRRVLAGRLYFSAQMESLLFEKLRTGRARVEESEVSLLSDRELEVFLLIGRGFANKEIAHALGVSAKTVDAHRTHMKQKLRLRSGAELTRRAIEWVSKRVG